MNFPEVTQPGNGKAEILTQTWLQSRREGGRGPRKAAEGRREGLQVQLWPQHKPGKPLAVFLPQPRS